MKEITNGYIIIVKIVIDGAYNGSIKTHVTVNDITTERLCSSGCLSSIGMLISDLSTLSKSSILRSKIKIVPTDALRRIVGAILYALF